MGRDWLINLSDFLIGWAGGYLTSQSIATFHSDDDAAFSTFSSLWTNMSPRKPWRIVADRRVSELPVRWGATRAKKSTKHQNSFPHPRRPRMSLNVPVSKIDIKTPTTWEIMKLCRIVECSWIYLLVNTSSILNRNLLCYSGTKRFNIFVSHLLKRSEASFIMGGPQKHR